jgi:SAM-dependent methyltransferase
MSVWFEEDLLWERFAVSMFSRRREAGTAREVDELVALLSLRPGVRVLDLCCGGGRHALELARRGYKVTGVDRTRAYLDRAQSIAAQEKLSVELVCSDMRDFEREGAFDVALNLFTSFGYFEDPEDDFRVVRHLFASLDAGGQVVMDVNGKEIIARAFRARDWHRLEDGSLFLEERVLDPGWEAVRSKWILISGTDRFERDVHVRLYSAAELSALLRSVGFQDIATFGNLQGAPYDAEAQRLIVRARKR